MRKIVFTSDLHFGLTTSDIDRTPEIVKVTLDVVKHCIKLKKKGFDVLLIIGGDIFHHNTPNEYLIGQFIRVLNLIKKHNIKTYIMVGNHDSISSDPERNSCLDFIDKIKKGYNNISLISDVKCFEYFVSDYGPVYLTFLPHITKNFLATHKNLKKVSTQDYLNKKADDIWKKIGVGVNSYVFTHLDIHGAHPGSEENMLKNLRFIYQRF